MLRASVLLALSLAAPALAWAQDAAPFVTQLRLPARGAAIDVVAWRGAEGIEVASADLERLSIALPAQSGERVALASIPGLSVHEDEAAAAIVLRCTASCLEPQRIGAVLEAPTRVDRAAGGYLNYDLDLQWQEDAGTTAAGLAHVGIFWPLGSDRVELAWGEQRTRRDAAGNALDHRRSSAAAALARWR